MTCRSGRLGPPAPAPLAIPSTARSNTWKRCHFQIQEKDADLGAFPDTFD